MAAFLRLVDPDEVANLPEHTRELRGLLVLGGAADLAQSERAQRAAMPLGLTDLAANLRDLKFRHCRSPPAEPTARMPPCAPRPPLRGRAFGSEGPAPPLARASR